MKSTATRESRDLSKKRETSMSSKVRLRHHLFRNIKLCNLICTIVIAGAAGIGCTSPSDEAWQGAEQSAPAVAQTEVESEAHTEAAVNACHAARDFCTSLAECRNLGHTTGLSGCRTGQVCCEAD
jgi:hypothetical protein